MLAAESIPKMQDRDTDFLVFQLLRMRGLAKPVDTGSNEFLLQKSVVERIRARLLSLSQTAQTTAVMRLKTMNSK